jgi:hypothetical protein
MEQNPMCHAAKPDSLFGIGVKIDKIAIVNPALFLDIPHCGYHNPGVEAARV